MEGEGKGQAERVSLLPVCPSPLLLALTPLALLAPLWPSLLLQWLKLPVVADRL